MALLNTNYQDLANRIDNATKVFEQYGAFIRSVIRHQAKDDNQVDDLFQDFFLSLVSIPLPKNTRSIKNYLYRAIINDILDTAIRMERYKTAVQRFSENLHFSINNCSSTDAYIESEETERMFELITELLPRSQARAIGLRYINGYKAAEIAEKMNVNTKSVRSYISIGLKTLRLLWTINKEE